jgi:hypothetical protein
MNQSEPEEKEAPGRPPPLLLKHSERRCIIESQRETRGDAQDPEQSGYRQTEYEQK